MHHPLYHAYQAPYLATLTHAHHQLACFLLIATSLSFTLALLQLLRAVAAPKLVAVGPERIRAHMATIFF